MTGLYVHVPFCASLCSYCTFARGLLDDRLKSRYLDAVVREIESSHPTGFSPDSQAHTADAHPEGRTPATDQQVVADTIYFGGGTPSLLDPQEIGRILEACRRAFVVDPAVEVTLEANPESVTPASLAGYRAAGVNRLSFGVQSFNDLELRRLGRVHDAARAREAVAEARAAGFDNLSLDLMLWLPGQVMADVVASVESLIDLDPEHASLYLLELYTSSPLTQTATRSGWRQAPDDVAADMYLRAMGRLERAGYRQYEISNLAKPGRESRHNLKYWTGGDWLAFGPAAHSTWNGLRWNNVVGTEDYVVRVASGRPPDLGRRRLSARERLEETLFMGLRLADGVDLGMVHRRFGVDVGREYGYRLTPYFGAGLLVAEGGRLRLTREGMLLANEVMSVFLDARSAKP
jgi:oxygen-independent coproporphyrinogen-3 oxidase